jgi:putative tryptophan/tyrosine transport system substrate-binding protein
MRSAVRIAGGLLAAFLCVAAPAQQNLPRVGFISGLGPDVMKSRVQAFRQGLKERGYIEGRNIIVEYRWAEGRRERLVPLAKELAATKPNVIVTAGPGYTKIFRDVKASTPIVMAFDPDPLGSGFVASLARPGGNITGLSSAAPEVSGKQIDLLRQIVPKLARIGLVWDSREPGNDKTRRELERAASLIGVKVIAFDQQAYKQIDDIFEGIESRVEALVVLTNAVVVDRRSILIRLAAQARVPTMWPHADLVEEGGLITYATNVEDLFRRAAIYVDRIVKGAKPGDLPVEQPYKFDLVINLKAAQAIGLAIPVNLLSRSDRVIQ